MRSDKGYYIDIEKGVVYTAEEREEAWCKKFSEAIKELKALDALMKDYFCRYNVCGEHSMLERLGFEISMRDQSIEAVIDLLKGGANND